MQQFIKNIIIIILKVIVFFIHKNIIRAILFVITNVTTQYIIKQLAQCGKNPRIMFPITSHGLEYISIGNNFNACSRLRLEAYSKPLDGFNIPELIICNNVSINYDCHIGCVNKILIGNNVLIASKVLIIDHFHGKTTIESLKLPPNLRKITSKGPVIIEDNVWIGEGVAIMPNVRIGKNTIIGANAVVTKDIPANSIVGGNPARIIKSV
ncbi:acyltransferase [Sulfurospirillum diekertiae]|nr:acyltransferase [Sulfurospirillum diekertiae]